MADLKKWIQKKKKPKKREYGTEKPAYDKNRISDSGDATTTAYYPDPTKWTDKKTFEWAISIRDMLEKRRREETPEKKSGAGYSGKTDYSK